MHDGSAGFLPEFSFMLTDCREINSRQSLITIFDSIYDFTAKSYLFFSGVKSSSMTFHAASTLKYSRMYFWVSSHILRHSAGS